MSISLPWYAVALIFLVTFWPVTLLVATVLGFVGASMRGVWRWASWAVSAVLTLVLLAGAAFYFHDPVSDWWKKQQLKHISGKLVSPKTVQGIMLPAGTDVQWANTSRSDFYVASLPASSTTAMLGVVVKGEIDHDARFQEQYYDVTLAAPKQAEGWHCGPGDARLKEDGRMLACTLASDTLWRGLALPAGTFLDGTFAEMEFVMPDGRGMALFGGAMSVPAGGVITAAPNGTLIELRATWRHPKPNSTDEGMALPERGVKLDATARFYPTQNPYEDGPKLQASSVFGKLLEEVRCAGETLPAGTAVEVPIRGELRVAGTPDRVVAGCLQ